MTDRERAIAAIRRGVPLGEVVMCSCNTKPPTRKGCSARQERSRVPRFVPCGLGRSVWKGRQGRDELLGRMHRRCQSPILTENRG